MPTPFKPTVEQLEFIESAPLESVLIACPGSGKTRTAVMRFIERCKANTPYGIAFLSYTNVAVEEALNRARDNNAGGLIGYPNLVSTIDSFFRQFIFEPFIRIALEDVAINVAVFESRAPAAIRDAKQYQIYGLRPAIKLKKQSMSLPVPAWEIRAYVADDGSLKYEYNSDTYKETWVDVPNGLHAKIESAKLQYVTRGYATYNDILLFCRALLAKDELHVAQILAQRFGEILVDEAQDTSALQQALLEQLVSAGVKISYIGDPQQGIYQFNRANPGYLERLAKTTHRRYSLTKNFRSIQAIVSVVNSRFNCGMSHDREVGHEVHGAYVFVGSESDALASFDKLLERIGDRSDAAVIVRKRTHLSSTLEDYDTKGWRTGPRLALEAWQRERRMDLDGALTSIVRLLRTAGADEVFGSKDENELREIGWLMLRGGHFPQPGGDETPKAWAIRLKAGLEAFLTTHNITKHSGFSERLSLHNIPDKGIALQEFSFTPPSLRTTVIHQVKGESIAAVLVICPKKQHAIWLDPAAKEEERNVCYVAFTRAADILVLHCPDEEIAERWRQHGFVEFPT